MHTILPIPTCLPILSSSPLSSRILTMAIPTILIVEEPERDLYGRVKEKAAISVAYDQCMDLATAMRGSEKSHVILVHGPSGSGKTALLQHVFEERIRQEGGFFIYGKFDSVPSASPGQPLWTLSAICVYSVLLPKDDRKYERRFARN
jgi:predicted ATPase